MRWLAAFALIVGCLGACVAGCSSSPKAPPADAAPDASMDLCMLCHIDEACVARYDGTCHVSTSCLTRTSACPTNACTPACEAMYCGAPYQCMTRSPCGGESPHAFTCYGP